MEKSGIYIITNLINNKKYVGSSKNVKVRIRTHKNLLSLNKHSNKYMQAAYNKVGKMSFSYTVVEFTTDLQSREQYWCSLLKTHNQDYGYNLAAIVRGEEISEEFRQRQIDDAKGSKRVFIFK